MTKRSNTNTKALATAWAYEAAESLPASTWKVLMMLARRVNRDREDYDVWPSQELIAEDCGMSVRSVTRHLALLEKDKWLTRHARTGRGRGFVGLIYTLNVKATFDMPDGRQTKVDFYAEDQVPGGQNGAHRDANDGVHRHAKCGVPEREHRNGEHRNGENPLTPKGEGDLFGEEIVNRVSDADIESIYVERWNALAAVAERIEPIKVFGGKKLTHLCRRIDDDPKARSRLRADVTDLIDELVSRIDRNRFLRGDATDWRTPAAWPVLPTNFEKIMDGFYPNDAANGSGWKSDRAVREGHTFMETGQEVKQFLDDLDRRTAEAGGAYPFGYL